MIQIFYIILALLLGIFAGTITGLTPGIHVNLVSAFLIASLPFLAFLQPIVLAVFVISMAITHTFTDFIPSIFLGSPDEDTALSILPGHEFLNKGLGYKAVIYTLYGSILGIIIILLFTPVFIFILPLAYPYIKTAMFFILVFASLYLMLREKNKILSLFIFLLAGFLGLATLNLNLKESLLPLLTGLFGASSLITSIIKKTKLPKQIITPIRNIKVTKSEIASSGIAAILSAPLCSFLPALGSGQAAVIGSDLTGEKDRKKFLILLGSINTIVAGLAFIALYSLQVTRTGTSVALEKILTSITTNHLFIILATIIISGIFASFLTIFLAKFFAKKISLINYRKLSLGILFFLSLVVLIFSGLVGFLVFAIATATGLTCILLNVRRTNLMSCLMLPAILLYLPI